MISRAHRVGGPGVSASVASLSWHSGPSGSNVGGRRQTNTDAHVLPTANHPARKAGADLSRRPTPNLPRLAISATEPSANIDAGKDPTMRVIRSRSLLRPGVVACLLQLATVDLALRRYGTVVAVATSSRTRVRVGQRGEYPVRRGTRMTPTGVSVRRRCQSDSSRPRR
jgi:hypothetical protein